MTPIADDLVLPFEIKPLGVRGRLVRLGATVNQILQVHDYPPTVSALVAEAAALTSMLGSALKFDGKFILQTKSGGPIDMLVADYHGPGQVRAYAHFDGKALQSVTGRNEAALLGTGHLATKDPRLGTATDAGIQRLHPCFARARRFQPLHANLAATRCRQPEGACR